MPLPSSCVLSVWQAAHNDWNRFNRNFAGSRRCGNTWSTWFAAVIFPSLWHRPHNGWRDSCDARIFSHTRCPYSLRLAFAFSEKPPPCWMQKVERPVLGFWHPSSRHLVLSGAIGILSYRRLPVFPGSQSVARQANSKPLRHGRIC